MIVQLILLLCSAFVLAGLALLPIPVEITTYSVWKDVAAADRPTRHITRIDTACAATQFSTKEEFARDFFIVPFLDIHYWHLKSDIGCPRIAFHAFWHPHIMHCLSIEKMCTQYI
jgi:hypothetical protein